MSNYVVAHIALGLFVVVSHALLNWKMPYERANRWGLLPRLLFLIGLYVINVSTIYVSIDGETVRTHDHAEFVIGAAIFLMIIPLLFIATGYIQHLKDKTDLKAAQGFIRDAVISHIATVIVIASFILFVLYPGS